MTGTEGSWHAQVDTYLDALERGDRSAAVGQVRGLRRAGHDLLEVIQQLLVPAQLRIGELWASDTWSVAQEHAATAISESVLGSLALEREAQARPGREQPSLVVSCVEQEWHALPALMVAEHLRADGFGVSYLGANSSAQGLVRHVHETGPSAVLLSCSLSSFLPLVRRQVEAVRETGTPVVVGGSAFDAEGRRARTLGANAFASTASGLGDLVRGLPTAVGPAAPLTHRGAEESYVVFGDREALADEAGRLLRSELVPGGARPEWERVLDDQLPHLVGCVAGALVADDPRIVGDALAWAEVVLSHRGAPDVVGLALRQALLGALHDVPEAARLLTATR